MSDNDVPEDRPTEGVRIIGAQEAAEVAGRPDVVRRRPSNEKRFGDRPDTPEPASDLPKITISTTEGDGVDRYDDDRYGQVIEPDDLDEVPSVQPSGTYDDDQRAGFGHARIVGDEDFPRSDDDDVAAGSPSSATPEWEDPYEPPSWDRDVSASEPLGDAAGNDAQPYVGSRVDDPGVTQTGTPTMGADDDSFVLPHWTEPPTGQVPKVVVGEGGPEPESLASYGSQPRWREEGERTSVTDFDDLVGDGPTLGDLGNDALANEAIEDDFFASPPTGDGHFATEFALSDTGDEGEEPVATRRPARQRPRGEGAETSVRTERPLGVAVAVGVGLVFVGLLCFRLGALPTTILATVVVTMAGLEYFTAVRERGNNPATLLGMVSIAGLMIATSAAGLAAYPIVIGLTVMFGLLWYLWVAPGDRSVANLGITLLGVAWIGFLGSFATLFLGLGRVLEDVSPRITTNPGIGVLIAAVIAAVSHDVGAYFSGKHLGHTPLSTASPNKTQEGLVGGVLSSLVVTFLIVGVIGISPIGDGIAQAFIFALLCALVAPLGDLCESFIKRDLGIKDMGSLLPGHGGVLDRFDALLFVLPVAYFVTVLFDVWGNVG